MNLIENNRIKNFPIMMFAMVMGLAGLTITYQKAHLWLGVDATIGIVLMCITTFVFITITVIYLMKLILYPSLVKKEFLHPIRINFFAAVSISLLMLTIIYKQYSVEISSYFFYVGLGLHFYLTMYTISFWINQNQKLDHSNPAWFIPVVGNVLIPVAGVDYLSNDTLMYFLSVGMFFWIILFSIILNRIIFHNQLANKFMPTLFILIAPPAVGFLAYFTMFREIDMFAKFLFDIAIFFTLLVFFMYKNFIKLEYFISWWAFIFPLSAMSISTMLMYHNSYKFYFLLFSYFMVFLTTIIVCIVIYKTIINITKQQICIEE